MNTCGGTPGRATGTSPSSSTSPGVMVDLIVRYSKQARQFGQITRVHGTAAEQRRVSKHRPTRPHRIEQRLTVEERDAILDAYRRGESAHQLGAEYGLTNTSILAMASEAGVPRQQTRLTNDQISEAAELYATGMSLMEVGKRLGVASTTVRYALHRSGAPVRPGRGTPEWRRFADDRARSYDAAT